MKIKYDALIQTLLILILSSGFNNAVNAQDNRNDTIPSKSIELPRGCKLVLDQKIDLTDTISVEIITGIVIFCLRYKN